MIISGSMCTEYMINVPNISVSLSVCLSVCLSIINYKKYEILQEIYIIK